MDYIVHRTSSLDARVQYFLSVLAFIASRSVKAILRYLRHGTHRHHELVEVRRILLRWTHYVSAVFRVSQGAYALPATFHHICTLLAYPRILSPFHDSL